MSAIDQELICKVNLLLERHPGSVTRLCTTVAHNRAIGGAEKSYHLTGEAVDLVFDRHASLLLAARYARDLGFLGIEVDFRNNHLHLDLRKVKWEVVYTTEKKYTLTEYLALDTLPPSV